MKTEIDTERKADNRFDKACAKAQEEFEAKWKPAMDKAGKLLEEAELLRKEALVFFSKARVAALAQYNADREAIRKQKETT